MAKSFDDMELVYARTVADNEIYRIGETPMRFPPAKSKVAAMSCPRNVFTVEYEDGSVEVIHGGVARVYKPNSAE